MKIEHIALWVQDLEGMKSFYQTYFNGIPNQKYKNESKGFSSYFLSFSSGARLELMHKESISKTGDDPLRQAAGYIHLAFSIGSKEKVDVLTSKLEKAGFSILDGPRTTGDGYYESVLLDPEGNRLEITV